MLSVCSRVWRAAVPVTRSFAPVPTRGKKKKASKRASGSADVSPEIASLVDLAKFESSMRKTVEALQSNLSKLRAGGAAPGILDGKYCTTVFLSPFLS